MVSLSIAQLLWFRLFLCFFLLGTRSRIRVVSARKLFETCLQLFIYLESGVFHFQNLESIQSIQLISWWTKSVQSVWYTKSTSFNPHSLCLKHLKIYSDWLRNQLGINPDFSGIVSVDPHNGESGAELARRCFRLEARGLSRGARGWRKCSGRWKF